MKDSERVGRINWRNGMEPGKKLVEDMKEYFVSARDVLHFKFSVDNLKKKIRIFVAFL